MEHHKIVLVAIANLSAGDRSALEELTNVKSARSVFWRWLRHPNPQGMYAALVRVEGAIVGWAAVSLGEGWNAGQVGAFIVPEFRGRGFARAALATLLPEAKRRHPRWPEYLYYEQQMATLFAPVVAASGFKDRWIAADEYVRHCRAATG